MFEGREHVQGLGRLPFTPSSQPWAPTAAHKQQSGCSGKRDRTAFLGRAQLDERSLLSGKSIAPRCD